MNDKQKESETRESISGDLYRAVCGHETGPLSASFLCQSVSMLNLPDPMCVSLDDSVDQVMGELRDNRRGCMLVINQQGKLVGIFSERDFVLKVYGSTLDLKKTPIAEFMTKDPVTQPPDASVAHVLSLMSEGGFRHIPIVDSDSAPVWMLSIKDVIDFIVNSHTEALLNFKTD